MADLTTKMGSLELENPIIVSSGYLTDTEIGIRKADERGPGAIVLKTSLIGDEYTQHIARPYAPGKYPTPMAKFHYLDGDFLYGEAMSTRPLEYWADWLAKNKRQFRAPLIASVISVSTEGRVRAARMMEAAGAVAVELLFACPAPYFMPHGYTVSHVPEVIEEVCRAVKSTLTIPVGAKVEANPHDLAKAACRAGVDWVTIVGGTLHSALPPINLDTLELVMPYIYTVSRKTEQKYRFFRDLWELRDTARKTHFSLTGGIRTWQDVAQLIMYGAGSIQAHAGFMLKGFSLIQDMKQGLAGYMDKKGFASLGGMRGTILPKVMTYDEALALHAKTKGQIIARVDEDECNKCGLCEEICAFGAIKVSANSARVDRSLCEGCGLCTAACPTGAVHLENLHLLKKPTLM